MEHYPTQEEMTGLFHAEFPKIRPEVLDAAAKALTTHHPKQSAFIKMVMDSDASTPGRHEALQVLKDALRASGYVTTSGDAIPVSRLGAALVRGLAVNTASPAKVFVTTAHDWSVEFERSQFREFLWEWGMTKAVDELGLERDDFAYVLSRAARYHASVCHEIAGSKTEFIDEAYSVHYYRAVAVISALDAHFEASQALRFMHWLEENDVDLKKVLTISEAIFDTPAYLQAIDPERLEPLLRGEDSITLVSGLL